MGFSKQSSQHKAFFLKKRSKKLFHGGQGPPYGGLRFKSFLVLFFKKGLLALISNSRAADGLQGGCHFGGGVVVGKTYAQHTGIFGNA